MSSSPRIVATLVALVLSTAIGGTAIAASSASIEQVRNGQATATITPTPTWGTGNAGASNSHYLESHSITYRTVMDQLPTDGTVIEMVIGYDVKRSGSYALDYLTQYQRVLPHVLFAHRDPEVFDPLNGITGVGSTVTTAPIPLPTRNLVVDPDGVDPEPAAAQPAASMMALPAAERVMTLFGGNIIDVSYVSEGDVALATSSSETQIKVRFTATSPKAVLAWGGHIACRWDWGFNADGSPRSAGGISGSSYHMRLVTWNLGNLGNQDRSMSTDAVYPVPKCGVSNLGPFCAGSTNTHAAPAGMETYRWSLFDNTSGAVIVGSDSSLSVVVHTTTGGRYSLLLTTGASGFTRQCQGTVTVNPPAVADAGADQTACVSAPQVQLAGAVSGGSGAWSGGAGSFSPGPSALNATYSPTAAEIAAGGVTLTLTCAPSVGPCTATSDAMRITFTPIATANAGVDQTVCASAPQVRLAGVAGGGAASGTWSGGAGSFDPGASALNATYTPAETEIASGGVTLTLTTNDPVGPCDAATDQVHIAINPVATVDAGAGQTVCANVPQVRLAGVVGGGASSGMWSGGAGGFNPGASSLNAVYTPSAGEIAAGSVTLTLTSNDPAGPCGAASAQMKITINPAATANAGPDQTVCASAPQVQLAGSVDGGASSGTWSGGAGAFTPDASTPNATYIPSAGEIASGSVTLTLTSDDPTGPCDAATDQVHIAINPVATADAGPDQTVCGANPQAQLAGIVGGGATSGTWSGGAGSFSPNASAVNAVYTPSTAEIAAGGVTLTLTTNDPAGPCGVAGDQLRLTISPAATANAGLDQTLCSGAPQVQLAGSVGGGASGGTWSGGGGSFNPNASALNAVYTPSAGEIAAGSVTLTLTTDDPTGPCPAAGDQMKVTFDTAATANAGVDQTVCSSAPQVQLAGSIGGGAAGGTWSGGAGSFSPNVSSLNATYTPAAAEIAAGSVTLTLTTNDPTGPCPSVSDQVRISISPATSVSAGPDQVVCSGSPRVQLAGSVGGTVASGTWSGGAGTFSPGATSLNATYTPSAGEVVAGHVTLTLTSATPTGPCPAASDAMNITINPLPTVNAGPDQIVCPTSPQAQLAGSMGGGASSATWSGGTGSFNPNASSPTATYTPSAAEIAAGSVTLTLTTNDPAGPCPAASDPMKITIDAPTVSVTDRVVCSGIAPVTLCANAGNGVGPYTYLWDTGAKTSCITVADTGSYRVTITDAKGCTASGHGVFRQRDCQGQLVHTTTTCATFMAGTADDLPSSDVNVVLKDNVITSISPGVFFYFSKITAPSSDFTIQIVQARSSSYFPFLELQQGQVTLYDADCNNVGSGAETSPGQAAITVHGATAGKVFILNAKYSLKTLVGLYMTPSMGVQYDFRTVINGQVVDSDPDGLHIGAALVAGVGDAPTINDGLQLYRPTPNPFRGGMRMAYMVASQGDRVSIRIYDLSGRLVRSLVDGSQNAGRHVAAWDARDEQGSRVHDGLYFVHFRLGDQTRQVRVTFLQ